MSNSHRTLFTVSLVDSRSKKRHINFYLESSARAFFERMVRTEGISYVELVRQDASGVLTLASHFEEPEGGDQ